MSRAPARPMPREEGPSWPSPRHQHARLGTVATWAGVTRVTASPDGVQAVELPSWRDGQTGAARRAGDHGRAWRSERSGHPAATRHLRHALAELADYFAGARQEFHRRSIPTARRSTAVSGMRSRRCRTARRARIRKSPVKWVRRQPCARSAARMAPTPSRRSCRAIASSAATGGCTARSRPAAQAPLAGDRARSQRARTMILRPGSTDWPRAWARTPLLGSRATRVYCRPGCPVLARGWERPRRCFRAPGEPEAAGYRPCAVCRPDAT